VETCVVDHTRFDTRETFDAAMIKTIDSYSPDLVVLAGFMRILTDDFRAPLRRSPAQHSSLAAAVFPGLHTHRRALEEGVRVHGCTVHFVTPQLDHGPVVVQAAVPVLDGDDEATLAARVLVQEHQVYPMAVRWFAEERLRLVDGHVVFEAEQAAGRRLDLAAGAGFALGCSRGFHALCLAHRAGGLARNSCRSLVPDRRWILALLSPSRCR
jgi:phosphoribosylglycinamide formyltransferase-1